MKVALVAVLALVGTTFLGVAAAWPCTCDPNPVQGTVQCAFDATACPDVVEASGLDPRTWPCACDPGPSPL